MERQLRVRVVRGFWIAAAGILIAIVMPILIGIAWQPQFNPADLVRLF
jgi:hypothetical protein